MNLRPEDRSPHIYIDCVSAVRGSWSNEEAMSVAAAYRARDVRFAACTLLVSFDLWLLGRLPAPALVFESRPGVFRWSYGFVPPEALAELAVLRSWAPAADEHFTAALSGVPSMRALRAESGWSFLPTGSLDLEDIARQIRQRDSL